MKRILQATFLAGLCVACSDFFPRQTVTLGSGTRMTMALPNKATLDPRACDYGSLDGGDVRRQGLWTLTTQHICPQVRELRYQVTALRLAGEAACGIGASARAQVDLEHHFVGAVGHMQYLMALPIGLWSENSGQLGMEIYSWPHSNRLALNEEMLQAARDPKGYSPNLPPSRKGFPAIENLIYRPTAVLIPGVRGRYRPEEAEFNAKPESERQAARCVVLQAMLNDLGQQVETLYGSWSEGAGAYPRQLIARLDAGEGQMVLNEVSNGMFYFERLKDYKIGLPLALNARCAKEKCSDQVEHQPSGASILAMHANVAAFRQGMSDLFLPLLKSVGREDLARSITEQIDAIDLNLNTLDANATLEAQVNALDKTTCEAPNGILETGAPPLCQLYYEVKDLMALYKSDLMSALNLQPPRTDADND